MSNYPDLDRIDDEDALESLLNQTEDLELRRKIRRRQSNIREKRLAEYEANRVVRLDQTSNEDLTTVRLRRAQEEKQRKMREFEEQAKQQRQTGSAGEDAVRQRQIKAEEEKQQRLQHLRDMGKVLSTVYNTGVNDILQEKNQPAKEDVNSANFMRNDVRRFKQPTGVLGFGGTSYGAKAAATQDNSNRGGITHNPAAVKQILLDWCKAQVAGYDNVNVTNFSSSWSDGLAFCALIHHFHPDAFDFKKLNPKNRRANFTLAFTTAEKLADVYPVLDVEDMVHMKNPDWKCVFTYVQGFYRRFALQQK